MAHILVSRPNVSRASSEKGEPSLDYKDATGSELEVAETPKERRRWWSRRSGRDLDAIATQPSVFDDPTTLETYRPPASYENTHRFDPAARWTWREELVSTPRPRRFADGLMLRLLSACGPQD